MQVAIGFVGDYIPGGLSPQMYNMPVIRKEDVAHIDILAGQVPEDPEVPGTVGQGQFNLHAVVVGIGKKAVLRKSVQTERNVKLA